MKNISLLIGEYFKTIDKKNQKFTPNEMKENNEEHKM